MMMTKHDDNASYQFGYEAEVRRQRAETRVIAGRRRFCFVPAPRTKYEGSPGRARRFGPDCPRQPGTGRATPKPWGLTLPLPLDLAL
jgi:hypothetical protein